MASKTERFSVRAREQQSDRWRRAAGALRLDEMSDYFRRAADELADRVLTPTEAAGPAERVPPAPAARAAASAGAKPDPKTKPRGGTK